MHKANLIMSGLTEKKKKKKKREKESKGHPEYFT